MTCRCTCFATWGQVCARSCRLVLICAEAAAIDQSIRSLSRVSVQAPARRLFAKRDIMARKLAARLDFRVRHLRRSPLRRRLHATHSGRRYRDIHRGLLWTGQCDAILAVPARPRLRKRRTYFHLAVASAAQILYLLFLARLRLALLARGKLHLALVEEATGACVRRDHDRFLMRRNPLPFAPQSLPQDWRVLCLVCPNPRIHHSRFTGCRTCNSSNTPAA